MRHYDREGHLGGYKYQEGSNMKYIISHDIGTSSDKAVLVDFDGNIVATVAEPYPTYYPAPAHVEQDPNDYWKAVCITSAKATLLIDHI